MPRRSSPLWYVLIFFNLFRYAAWWRQAEEAGQHGSAAARGTGRRRQRRRRLTASRRGREAQGHVAGVISSLLLYFLRHEIRGRVRGGEPQLLALEADLNATKADSRARERWAGAMCSCGLQIGCCNVLVPTPAPPPAQRAVVGSADNADVASEIKAQLAHATQAARELAPLLEVGRPSCQGRSSLVYHSSSKIALAISASHLSCKDMDLLDVRLMEKVVDSRTLSSALEKLYF